MVVVVVVVVVAMVVIAMVVIAMVVVATVVIAMVVVAAVCYRGGLFFFLPRGVDVIFLLQGRSAGGHPLFFWSVLCFEDGKETGTQGAAHQGRNEDVFPRVVGWENKGRVLVGQSLQHLHYDLSVLFHCLLLTGIKPKEHERFFHASCRMLFLVVFFNRLCNVQGRHFDVGVLVVHVYGGIFNGGHDKTVY